MKRCKVWYKVWMPRKAQDVPSIDILPHMYGKHTTVVIVVGRRRCTVNIPASSVPVLEDGSHSSSGK